MPSVHRQPRTPFWIGHFTDPNGKRIARSTKETERAAAMATAEKWQREADILAANKSKGPGDCIQLDNPSQLLEAFISLSQRAKAGTLNLNDGQKLVSDLLAASGQDRLRNETTREVFAAFVRAKTTARSDSTAKAYKQFCEAFVSFLGKRADLPLANVTARDIEDFRDGELARGVCGASANHALKILTAPFNQARRLGHITHNPCEAVDAVGHEAAIRKPFTAEELSALLAAADNEWRGMILLAYTTGFRISDCSRLKWADVNLSRGVITQRPKKERRDKAAKKQETVILDELREWLTANQGVGEAFVFPTIAKKPPSGASGTSTTFFKLMDKAHIVITNLSPAGSKRAFYDKGFHSLRHTFVSAATNAGVAKEIRMEQAGHNSNVAKRYEHREVAAVKTALDAFPRITPKPPVAV